MEGSDLTPEQMARLGRSFPVGKGFTGKLRRLKVSAEECGDVPELVLLSMQALSVPIKPEGYSSVTSMDSLVSMSASIDPHPTDESKPGFAGLDQHLWTADIAYGQFVLQRSDVRSAVNIHTCTAKSAAQAWSYSIAAWSGQATLGNITLRDSMMCTEVDLF
jgi:hypothetical protein